MGPNNGRSASDLSASVQFELAPGAANQVLLGLKACLESSEFERELEAAVTQREVEHFRPKVVA